jgi:hypothetical protein
MLAGADRIDDHDIARHGGMRSLFTGVYAPSTLGSFMRPFTHGHVRQLQAAARDTLIGLAGRVPILSGADVLTFVDIDSKLRRVYGRIATTSRPALPSRRPHRCGHRPLPGFAVPQHRKPH